MEENLKTKHIITIPEGCIAQIDDNKIIIKEKLQEFKDGDILTCDYTGPYNLKIIMIYKGNRSKTGGYNCYAFRNHVGQIITNSDCCDNYVVRLATDKENKNFLSICVTISYNGTLKRKRQKNLGGERSMVKSIIELLFYKNRDIYRI